MLWVMRWLGSALALLLAGTARGEDGSAAQTAVKDPPRLIAMGWAGIGTRFVHQSSTGYLSSTAGTKLHGGVEGGMQLGARLTRSFGLTAVLNVNETRLGPVGNGLTIIETGAAAVFHGPAWFTFGPAIAFHLTEKGGELPSSGTGTSPSVFAHAWLPLGWWSMALHARAALDMLGRDDWQFSFSLGLGGN
jgi:hypothetical protein